MGVYCEKADDRKPPADAARAYRQITVPVCAAHLPGTIHQRARPSHNSAHEALRERPKVGKPLYRDGDLFFTRPKKRMSTRVDVAGTANLDCL